MLIEMIVWSAKQGAGGVPAAFVERFETDRERFIAELKHQIREQISSD